MYMTEITEDKLHSLIEHAEKGLKYMGKVMQCLSELEDEYSGEGAYGERGRLGMRNDEEDWWNEEEKKRKAYKKYAEHYGNRMRY